MQERVVTTQADEAFLLEEEKRSLHPRLLGKGGIAEILSYSKADRVAGYELYVTPDDIAKSPDELSALLEGLIIGAHNITYAKYEGAVRANNLSLEGPEGDFWEDAAKKTIDLLSYVGGSYFTTHIGELITAKELAYIKDGTPEQIVNAYWQAKRNHLLIAAERITRLAEYARTKGIQLAVENDTYWTSTKYEGTMFLNDPQSLSFFLAHVPEDVRVVFDEEHAYRAAVFGLFWEQYLPLHLKAKTRQQVQDQGTQTLKHVHDTIAIMGEDMFHETIIRPYLEQFLAVCGNRIIAVHNCGWDWRQDSTDLDTPLPGTSNHNLHLPVRRIIASIADEGVLLRDTIDHRLVLKLIRANCSETQFNRLNIVLEYARHQHDRKYRFHSKGKVPLPQSQEEEFAIAARSIRHLIRTL